jgi:bisphosphoglycerate-dependent phosphoglycerate mutase
VLPHASNEPFVALHELNQIHLPVQVGVSMNDIRYGSLTGLSKTQTAERLGVDLVKEDN